MPGRARLVASLVVLAGALGPAACADKQFAPSPRSVQLQFLMSPASQVAVARSVTVHVGYELTTGFVVPLVDQTTSMAVGTQQFAVEVDISR